MIGILGATGEVGRAATAFLAGRTALRLGSRTFAAAPDAEGRMGVDLDDARSVEQFVAGCTVVVNCAGPSVRYSEHVAQAALRAGVDLVDAGGDGALASRLDEPARAAERRIVLAAGALPGLSGLLPRLVAPNHRDVRAYFVVRDRFSRVAAADYLDGVLSASTRPLAGWRDGRVVANSLSRATLRLPQFAEPVPAFPFLDDEAEQVARSLGIARLDWYSAFEGPRLAGALDQTRGLDREQAIDLVCSASALDTAGLEPRTTFVVELDAAETVVFHGPGISELTGTTAAVAALAVQETSMPPGAGLAACVLDPERTFASIGQLAKVPGTIEDLSVVEDGVL
ncbi:hypothetical protein HPO96_09635 [Kribbella sandramycini]|uniref:Saccharopine dehydrogenase NADP binding domain-containing protein n=1 Tax=Kribbella sandramycini TaxID=60450 RepID=A0A7Y4NZW6_9ACTN|nr:saccharopine dehydrogenase NADP-binding domain-containing protein [Kribbella sandramycini]MBB6569663.1 hypothetical protein [Kribbella sandramycini]NOL40505.1 hypothetical protein [Kribbella sandramycini]